MDDRTPVVVVGAGQAGLATSYHLKRRGIEHVVLDQSDRVGDVWRHRWDSLRLFTPRKLSGLPGMTLDGPPHGYPTKDEVAEYFETYVSAFDLPVRTRTRVNRVAATDDLYQVETDGGTIVAENVVVATGAYQKPHIPDLAGDLEAGIVQLHSSEYRESSQVQAGPVLVVGAGNSGAEIAMELAGDHEVWLSGRDVGQEPTSAGTWPDRLMMPLYRFVGHHLSSVTNPIGRRIRDRFMNPPRGVPRGRIRKSDILDATVEWVGRTAGVEDGMPVIDDGRRLSVANVIWCTGFVPDYSWIDVPVFEDSGFPRHFRGVVEEQPGLYFMGLMFQTAISSALIFGVGRDAEHIVAQIERRGVAGRPMERPTAGNPT